MTGVWITVGVVIVLFIITMIIVPKIKYNKAKKILSNYENFKECKKKLYDFTLENDSLRVYIKLVDIPKNSLITINAKETWELSWGGSSDNKGRAYPNKKYLDEIKDYLKKDIESEDGKKVEKVILINKSTEKVVMYLNETELAVVTDKDRVYGYRIFQVKNIEKELDMLNIKLKEPLNK